MYKINPEPKRVCIIINLKFGSSNNEDVKMYTCTVAKCDLAPEVMSPIVFKI